MPNFYVKLTANLIIDALIVYLIYLAFSYFHGPIDLHALVFGCFISVGMYGMKWVTAGRCGNQELVNDAQAQTASMAIITFIISLMV